MGKAVCFRGSVVLIALSVIFWVAPAAPTAKSTQAKTTQAQFKAHVDRGNACAAKGAIEDAIDSYTNAISLNPRDASVHVSRGFMYHRKGDYDRAIADFDAAVGINPRLAQAYHNRAVSHVCKADALAPLIVAEIRGHPGAPARCAIEMPSPNRPELLSISLEEGFNQVPFGNSLVPDIWRTGSIHKIKGTVNIRGFTFASDAADPLVFELAPEGYTHKSGRGTVTAPDGRSWKLAPQAPRNPNLEEERHRHYLLAIADYDQAFAFEPGWPKLLYDKALICEKAKRPKEAADAYRKFVEMAPLGYQDLVESARQRLTQLQQQ
ncbi:MAG TPA: tetratricopeptide repeat protein [Armatimonadota bacterium]|nr:tetratricopeptide repeat protein [Armatimonadota bacterium]